MSKPSSGTQPPSFPPTLDVLPSPPEGKTGWPWTEQTDPLPETQPNGAPWPKISVVTPSYNQGQFIEETIRSVLLQGYPNLEYILIDGGSTDETVDILEKYDPWIDHWVSEPDKGQSHAINKGLKASTGAVWNWINSDDFLLLGALRVIGKNIKNSDAVLAETWIEKNNTCELERVINFRVENLLKGFRGGKIRQQGIWLKRKSVEECGGIDESIKYAMDRDLYARYLFRIINKRGFTRLKKISKGVALFRVYEESKSGKGLYRFINDHIETSKKIVSKTKSPNIKSKCQKYIRENRKFIARKKWQEKVSYEMKDKSNYKLLRALKIIYGIIKKPHKRLDRYSIGAIKRIFTRLV